MFTGGYYCFFRFDADCAVYVVYFDDFSSFPGVVYKDVDVFGRVVVDC